MCTHKKKKWNRYISQYIYVDCGECPACLQQKAIARTNRVRYQEKDTSFVSWFITLTYDNKYIPYIRQSEWIDFATGKVDCLKVHRDFKISQKLVKCKPYRQYKFVEEATFEDVCELHKEDFNNSKRNFDFESYSYYKFPFLRKWIDSNNYVYIDDKVGVLWYDDIRLFIMRLRNVLTRKYGVSKFKYAICGEYGPDSNRPHFHLPVWLPTSVTQDQVVAAVCEAWPYADAARTGSYIDRFRGDSYVASYINSGNSHTDFFQSALPFKARYRISNDFGYSYSKFKAEKLVESFFAGDLRFYTKKIEGSTVSTTAQVFPEYVINHYFAKFKGYSKLTPDQIFDIVIDPFKLYDLWQELGYFHHKAKDIEEFEFNLKYGISGNYKPRMSSLQIQQNIDLIFRLYKRFNEETGLGIYDFALIYSRIWATIAANRCIDKHCEVEHNADYLTFFLNVIDHYQGYLYHDLIDLGLSEDLSHMLKIPIDPNEFPDNIAKTRNLEKWYFEYCKDKNVRDKIFQTKVS